MALRVASMIPCPLALVTVAASSVIAFAESMTFGTITTFVSVAGLGIMGFYFNWRDRRRIAMQSDAEAKTKEAEAQAKAAQAMVLQAEAEAAREKIEQDARLARERVAMEAGIALAARKEELLGKSLVAQNEKLQATMDALNDEMVAARGRVEDANRKLHAVINEQNAVRLTFEHDKLDWKDQMAALVAEQAKTKFIYDAERKTLHDEIAEYKRLLTEARVETAEARAENLRLMAQINSKVDAAKVNSEANKGRIEKLEQVQAASSSSSAIVASPLAVIADNTKATEANTAAMEKEKDSEV